MKISLLAVVCLMFCCSSGIAQTYGNTVQTKDLTFPLPQLSTIPQLHTDMTLDCFIGYVAMDSLMRSNISLFQALNLPSQMSIQDLRFVARLLYGMDEYSHTHLKAHFVATRDTGRSMYDDRPFMANFYTPVMKTIAIDRWQEFDPQHRALLLTHYIYRVRVVNVAQGIDSSYGSNPGNLRPITAVYCEVLEKIKGMKVPNNCPLYSPAEHKSSDDKSLGDGPACVAFSYNSRYNSSFLDTPRIGEEYYAFLDESLYNLEECYLTMTDPFRIGRVAPAILGGSPGMFRIKDGIVEDPKHFWSADTLTVEQFRSLLQSRVMEIKSWMPDS